jgi:hypothetical protein
MVWVHQKRIQPKNYNELINSKAFNGNVQYTLAKAESHVKPHGHTPVGSRGLALNSFIMAFAILKSNPSLYSSPHDIQTAIHCSKPLDFLVLGKNFLPCITVLTGSSYST